MSQTATAIPDFEFPLLRGSGKGPVVNQGMQDAPCWEATDERYRVTAQEDRPALAYRCHYPSGSTPCDLLTAIRFQKHVEQHLGA